MRGEGERALIAKVERGGNTEQAGSSSKSFGSDDGPSEVQTLGVFAASRT